MICRSCGAEIADKAIVCYRCGTPTAEAPARPSARRGPSRWPAVLVLAVIFVLGAWLIPMTKPGSPERIAAWVAAWVIVFGAMTWIRRRRS